MSTPVGGYILAADPIVINAGRPRRKLAVRNTGDRPVQVASHFHFFEVNRVRVCQVNGVTSFSVVTCVPR